MWRFRVVFFILPVSALLSSQFNNQVYGSCRIKQKTISKHLICMVEGKKGKKTVLKHLSATQLSNEQSKALEPSLSLDLDDAADSSTQTHFVGTWPRRGRQSKCLHEGCTKWASVGIEERQPLFCAEHKLEGMENVVSKRCEFLGCKSLTPVYNFPGEMRGKFCSTHKLEGMENCKHPRCSHEGCRVLASCGLVRNKPLYCTAHKLEGMEDVVSAFCKHEGCKVQAPSGYCKAHRPEWMRSGIAPVGGRRKKKER